VVIFDLIGHIAFAALVDQAIARRVAFLIVAGDIYDGEWRESCSLTEYRTSSPLGTCNATRGSLGNWGTASFASQLMETMSN
jgi:hypothetical protein